MRKRALLLCGLMLTGCSAQPVVRPIGGVVPASAESVAGPVAARDTLPSLSCERLSQAEQLQRSVVEERMKEGSYYAALAQVQALPAEAASVALLRADILRRVDPTAAARWYQALLGTCEAGHARQGLGLLAAGRGDYPQALQELQQAADAYPADAAVRHDLGMVQLHLGQDEAARFNLRTASELAPSDPQPRFSLMLLALVSQDAAEWRRLRDTWQPDSGQRENLQQACLRVMPVRMNLTGRAAGLRCPMDARLP